MQRSIVGVLVTVLSLVIVPLLSPEASAQPLPCTGFCDNGSYCENPNCPTAKCYSPDSIQSLLLCGACPVLCGPSFGFGECVGAGYCGPVPPDCVGVCLLDTDPLSQVICGGAYPGGCGSGTCFNGAYCDACLCYEPEAAVSQLFCTRTAAGKCKALDHFLCYRTRNLPGAPQFSPILGLQVEDQFGASTIDVKKSVTLCAPANKNDEDPEAPAHPDHLRSYPVKPSAAFTTVANQKVVNQFGSLFVDVLKATDLLVPTAKNPTGMPASPLSPAVDHFLCHALKSSKGAPKFTPILRVSIEDQFGTRLVDVIKPTRLCAPANKNGEDPNAPTHPDHLLCYQARLSKRVIQQEGVHKGGPKLVGQPFGSPIKPIYTNNQFGPEGVAAVGVVEFCVPSVKNAADRDEDPCPRDCDDGLFCTEDRCVEYNPAGPTDPLDPVCQGGSNDGRACPPADCGANPCAVPAFCQGGPNDGLACPPADCGAGNPCATYTPPNEQGCQHDWKTGPAFGDWLFEKEQGSDDLINVSRCCEESSECDDGNPCTGDVCIESEHRCFFEPLNPEECGVLNKIQAVVPVPPSPCISDDALEPRLCTIQGNVDDPWTLERPLGPADIHLHMLDEEAYGARWRHGKTGERLLTTCDGDGKDFPHHGRVETVAPLVSNLATCPPLLLQPAPALAWRLLTTLLGNSIVQQGGLLDKKVSAAFSESIGKIEGTKGDTGKHRKRREPGFGDWPRWDVMAHQRVHGKALFQAYYQGLRLIVVPMGGFKPFCELLPERNINYDCEEMADVDRQIALAHIFVDGTAAAPADQLQFGFGPRWVEIALSPQDAVRIIKDENKLAMVLEIETTDLFGSIFPAYPAPLPSDIDTQIRNKVDEYFAKGVRSVQIAHEQDNGFSGAALINPLFEMFQFAKNKYATATSPPCHVDQDCSSRLRFGFDVYEDPDDGVCKNKLGLTDAGVTLVQKLMANKMLIDVAHLSEAGFLHAYRLAKAEKYYPLFHSHTKFREMEPAFGANVVSNHHVVEHTVPAWVVQRIRRTGGMVGLRTGFLEERDYGGPSGGPPSVAAQTLLNACPGSSRSLAQAYEFGRLGLKVPMALGSDTNSFTQGTRPRYTDRSLSGRPRRNPNGACSAGFEIEGICQARVQDDNDRVHPGTHWGFDTLGLADAGFELDLLKDMKKLGANVSPLENSSVDFIRMWYRAAGLVGTGLSGSPSIPRLGPADLANNIDLSGIGAYEPTGARYNTYPNALCTLGLSPVLGLFIHPKFCKKIEQLGDPCRFDDECVDPLTCASGPFCGTPEGQCRCTKGGGCLAGQYCKLRIPGLAFDNECLAEKKTGEVCLRNKECESKNCKFSSIPPKCA